MTGRDTTRSVHHRRATSSSSRCCSWCRKAAACRGVPIRRSLPPTMTLATTTAPIVNFHPSHITQKTYLGGAMDECCVPNPAPHAHTHAHAVDGCIAPARCSSCITGAWSITIRANTTSRGPLLFLLKQTKSPAFRSLMLASAAAACLTPSSFRYQNTTAAEHSSEGSTAQPPAQPAYHLPSSMTNSTDTAVPAANINKRNIVNNTTTTRNRNDDDGAVTIAEGLLHAADAQHFAPQRQLLLLACCAYWRSKHIATANRGHEKEHPQQHQQHQQLEQRLTEPTWMDDETSNNTVIATTPRRRSIRLATRLQDAPPPSNGLTGRAAMTATAVPSTMVPHTEPTPATAATATIPNLPPPTSHTKDQNCSSSAVPNCGSSSVLCGGGDDVRCPRNDFDCKHSISHSGGDNQQRLTPNKYTPCYRLNFYLKPGCSTSWFPRPELRRWGHFASPQPTSGPPLPLLRSFATNVNNNVSDDDDEEDDDSLDDDLAVANDKASIFRRLDRVVVVASENSSGSHSRMPPPPPAAVQHFCRNRPRSHPVVIRIRDQHASTVPPPPPPRHDDGAASSVTSVARADATRADFPPPKSPVLALVEIGDYPDVQHLVWRGARHLQRKRHRARAAWSRLRRGTIHRRDSAAVRQGRCRQYRSAYRTAAMDVAD